MRFKIALLQMLVEGGHKERNLAHAEELIAEAARNGAQLAVLPEAMDLGWTHPSCQQEAEPIPEGEPAQRLKRAAVQHRIFICSGLTEREGERIFNSALLIDRQGRVLCTHRKLNELTIGHPYYAQGDRLNVARTELGTLGLMICADGFARDRVLSRALGYMGADIIVSPSAWAMPADHDDTRESYGAVWRDAYIPVAREFSMWIVGVSNVGPIRQGPWVGQKCIGCSLAVGPTGEVLLRGPYGEDAEAILYLDIDPVERPARGCGWEELWREQRDE